MKHFNVVILAALGVLVMIGMPLPAHADLITIGGSTSGSITFDSNGNGTVGVTYTALSDGAFFTGGPIGTYVFGGPSAFMSFTAGPVSGEKYPAGPQSAETFSFSDGTNSLLGSVTWSFIQDNTTNPKFFGTVDLTSISGTAKFKSAFGGVGSIDMIDFTTTAISSGTLDNLASSSAGTFAKVGISSGEVAGAATPEPSSVMLFGVGIVLIGLCVPLRQRISGEI